MIESKYTDIVRTKMSGVVTFDELLKHVEFLKMLELNGSALIEFTDQREVKNMEISNFEASQFARKAEPINDRYLSIHNVILATDPAIFGINRMLGAHISIKSAKPSWHFVKSQEEAEQLIITLTRMVNPELGNSCLAERDL